MEEIQLISDLGRLTRDELVRKAVVLHFGALYVYASLAKLV